MPIEEFLRPHPSNVSICIIMFYIKLCVISFKPDTKGLTHLTWSCSFVQMCFLVENYATHMKLIEETFKRHHIFLNLLIFIIKVRHPSKLA
jgi:hypothetical protein